MTPTPKNSVADIVIFTVNTHESNSVKAAFGGATPARPIEGRSYFDLGIFGGARVFHAITQMGDQATSAAARAAMAALKPKLLLCVGIAWGAMPGRCKIGDILLASRLHDWAHRKESRDDGVIPRGFTIPPSDNVLQMARTAYIDWRNDGSGIKPELHDGLLLSAPVLYDDEVERDKALETHPEAVGGEMEGRGLVWEASQAKLDWLVIKAVCDWGAGKNAPGVDKVGAQQLAAKNVASFVRHLIDSHLGPSFASVDAQASVPLPVLSAANIDLIFELGETVIPVYDNFELVLKSPEQVNRLVGRMKLGLQFKINVEIHDPTDYENLIISDPTISRQDLAEAVVVHLERRRAMLEQSITECISDIVHNYGTASDGALRGCIDSLSRRQSDSRQGWTWIDVFREADGASQYFKAQVPDENLDHIATKRGVERPLTRMHEVDLFDLGSDAVIAHVIPAAIHAKAHKPYAFDRFSAQDWSFGEA